MHFRVSTRRRGDKVYRYGQLVQSYRREDGTPAHRVLANLGRITELEADNLKAAFAAAKRGRAVVLDDRVAPTPLRPLANYVYLSAAVLLQLWDGIGLAEIVQELMPDEATDVPTTAVLTALVLQRCLDPASKLAAVDWFPTTALPELLDVRPRSFNNSRIHRALEAIETIERPLQQRLSARIASEAGAFVSLFLDCTDTWFVGRGPDLASMRVTKDRVLRNRVGIALLCDQRGLPLRWATVSGAHDETRTMLGILQQVADLNWARGVPIVMDRGMGCEQTVLSMEQLGVRFVTAVRSPELRAYSSRIPLCAFDDVDLGQEALAARAVELGFVPGAGGRYLLDLGVIIKGADDGKAVAVRSETSRATAAIRVSQWLVAALALGRTLPALGEQLDVSARTLQRYRELDLLGSDLVSRVLAGEADRVTPDVLRRIGRLPVGEQEAALGEAIDMAGEGAMLRPSRELAALAQLQPLKVRAVAVFGPEHFLGARRKAEEQLNGLHLFVEELNARLRNPTSRRTRTSALAEIGSELRRRKLLSVAQVAVNDVEVAGRKRLQVEIQLDQEAWRLRRRADGIQMVIAESRFVGSAEDLVTLYFARDKIEKDFRVIKSVLELRPIHHRTDPKVRAHVSLCVLALLLVRTLEARLSEAGIDRTAQSTLALLDTCHLNHYAETETPVYTTTRVTPDQQRLLTALGMEPLTDDDDLRARLSPR